MRAYHICNMYLSGIHAGIQSAHCQHELAVKMVDPGTPINRFNMYLDWAKNHKTIILLNGGYQSNLEEFIEAVTLTDYPWAEFRESNDALNGALTNVCVVLPEAMYGAAAANALEFFTNSDRDFGREFGVVTTEGEVYDHYYTVEEVHLLQVMSRMRLMS